MKYEQASKICQKQKYVSKDTVLQDSLQISRKKQTNQEEHNNKYTLMKDTSWGNTSLIGVEADVITLEN